MKYLLKACKYFYSDTEKLKFKKLGFAFKPEKCEGNNQWVIDFSKDLYIDINTLEELQQFIDEYGDIVISGDNIIIYNDYLE